MRGSLFIFIAIGLAVLLSAVLWRLPWLAPIHYVPVVACYLGLSNRSLAESIVTTATVAYVSEIVFVTQHGELMLSACLVCLFAYSMHVRYTRYGLRSRLLFYAGLGIACEFLATVTDMLAGRGVALPRWDLLFSAVFTVVVALVVFWGAAWADGEGERRMIAGQNG